MNWLQDFGTTRKQASVHRMAKQAMRLHHKQGISLKAAWRKVRRGRGKVRKTRKLTRKSIRKTRKTTRKSARKARKSARKSARKTRKTTRKSARKGLRRKSSAKSQVFRIMHRDNITLRSAWRKYKRGSRVTSKRKVKKESQKESHINSVRIGLIHWLYHTMVINSLLIWLQSGFGQNNLMGHLQCQTIYINLKTNIMYKYLY